MKLQTADKHRLCVMSRSFVLSAIFLSTLHSPLSTLRAEDRLNLDVAARFDYQRDWNDGNTVKDHTGFNLPYVFLKLDGNIVSGLNYHWRQRFNKSCLNGNFFNATDWLYIDYQLKDWNFAAGKEIVAIGGWEYDRHPINLYSTSVFWQNIPCYELGVSVGYDLTKNDRLSAQVVQSPFHAPGNHDMYGYNLMWTGRHGLFSSLYSANLFEYAPGKFISYIALGNKFDVGNVSLELDLMNRAASGQTFFFKDCSVMAELSYRPTPRWNIFGKVTYDVNKADTDADLCVASGTELTMAGAGVEFYPLKKQRTDLRVHANLFYAWGHNANTADIMQDKSMILNLGVTWNMNIVKLAKKPTDK